MKKFLFMCIVALSTMLVSCDQPDVCININVETVPCTFHTASLTPDVDDKPMTRTEDVSTSRTIHYVFTSDGHPTLEGTVLEHDNLYLDLVKNATYKGKFYYATNINADNMVNIVDEHVYAHDSVYNVAESFDKTITLTRQIGKLTAKVGHIPANTTVTFTIKTINKFNLRYDWYNPKDVLIDTKSSLVKNDEFSQLGAVSSSNDTMESYIEVFLYQGDKLKKSSKHFYHLNKNREKLVTFNINNVDDDKELGDFYIDINEKWGEIDGNNQQIGKPQP